MEDFTSQLSESIIDLVFKHSNISNGVKEFIYNENNAIRNIDKINDLVTKNLCDQKDNVILSDLLNILKSVSNCNMKENKNNLRRCKYYNRGYCKHGEKCSFQHFENSCEKYLQSGTCTQQRRCLYRHPKNCRYWIGKSEGCHRGNKCLYLHDPTKKFKDIDKNLQAGYSDETDYKNIVTSAKSHETKNTNSKTNDNSSKTDNVSSMNLKVITVKENETKEKLRDS